MIVVPKTQDDDPGRRYFNAELTRLLAWPLRIETTDVLRVRMQEIKDRIAIHRMFGRDNFANGVILRFQGECTIPRANLTYAAMKQGGRWWTTAVQPTEYGLHWDALVAQFLAFALPESVKVYAEENTYSFFNEEEQTKLLNLQYVIEQ